MDMLREARILRLSPRARGAFRRLQVELLADLASWLASPGASCVWSSGAYLIRTQVGRDQFFYCFDGSIGIVATCSLDRFYSVAGIGIHYVKCFDRRQLARALEDRAYDPTHR